jgi:transposase
MINDVFQLCSPYIFVMKSIISTSRLSLEDEQGAKSFFEQRISGKYICPLCFASPVYKLKDCRMRCPDCGYTFHIFSKRWINRGRLKFSDWLRVLECFEKRFTIEQTARLLSVKYDTAHKAFHTLRLAIFSSITGGDLLDVKGNLVRFCPNLDNEEQAMTHGCQSYVFALDVGWRTTSLRLLPGLKAREVVASPLKKRIWGRMIYTDQTQGNDALVFSCCRKGKELYARYFTDSPVHLDGRRDFKAFADAWLARYKNFSPEAYPLYLAEIVFRHNSQGQTLSPLLADMLCKLVPKRGD